MDNEVNVQQLPLNDLARRCAEETDRFRMRLKDDSRFCFELFRRAISERDQFAWDMICKQYKPLMADWWVKPHRGFKAGNEDLDEIINRTYEKFWSALTPEKFSKFSDLKPLLNYLKMCVESVIIDQNRKIEPPTQYPVDNDSPIWGKDPGLTPEEKMLDDEKRRYFRDWINSRLHDDKERLVVYGSFDLDLKPQELCDKFPNIFRDVDEVYTIKQNIINRLRRDPDFRKFLGKDD
ncbi:MAG: hypothetical protein ABI986_00755 [Chloroflexota bacterium]